MYRRARPEGLAGASGYGWRALVEADITRWKPVIGDGLRFQTDGRQATEVATAAAERNAGFGAPEVRSDHMTRNTGGAQCAQSADPCNKVMTVS
jgi:hypothetical protein